MAVEKESKITYQKTFYGTPVDVDKAVNAFKEQKIVTHSQCNACVDKNNNVIFFTTLFYKDKRW
jgi:hypothetical protein